MDLGNQLLPILQIRNPKSAIRNCPLFLRVSAREYARHIVQHVGGADVAIAVVLNEAAFDDIDFLLRGLPTDLPVVAIGASLGGNALLKWLGENPRQQIVKAAVTMSVPYDLASAARHLERGAGRLYVAGFLRTMKQKTVSVVERFGVTLDVPGAMRARTFHEFDNAATAPLHGVAQAAHPPPSRELAPEECWPGRSSAGPRAGDQSRADGGPPDP